MGAGSQNWNGYWGQQFAKWVQNSARLSVPRNWGSNLLPVLKGRAQRAASTPVWFSSLLQCHITLFASAHSASRLTLRGSDTSLQHFF